MMRVFLRFECGAGIARDVEPAEAGAGETHSSCPECGGEERATVETVYGPAEEVAR